MFFSHMLLKAATKDIPKQTYCFLEIHKNQRQIVNLDSKSWLSQRCLPNHQDYPWFRLLQMVPFILHHQHISYLSIIYGWVLQLYFFYILVAIFCCPLNKLLLTIAKHIFPCHGLNSHFCSKIPNFQSFLQDDYLPPFISAIRVSYQLGPKLPFEGNEQYFWWVCLWGWFFGFFCPQWCGIMIGFLQPDWPLSN